MQAPSLLEITNTLHDEHDPLRSQGEAKSKNSSSVVNKKACQGLSHKSNEFQCPAHLNFKTEQPSNQ
jgi:hypothetical protein